MSHSHRYAAWGASTRVGALAIAAALSVVVAVPVMATAETPDVGQTLTTAGEGAATITGSLDPFGDVDLYRICITAGGGFGAQVSAGGGDGQLFLFDDDGRGVAWNDDKADGQLEPALPAGNSLLAGLDAGVYYLGLSNFNVDPFSAAGRIFADSVTTVGDAVGGPVGPGGLDPLTSWSGAPGIYPAVTNYTVSTSGTAACSPPVLDLPADITVAADGVAGASSVTWTATAADALDGSITPTCIPASGSAFAFGATTVTCSATNSLGLTSTGSFTVTVSNLGWLGFYQPIDNDGVLNTIKGGSTVPVKFNVTAGDSLVTDPAIAEVSWVSIPCPDQRTSDAIEQTATSASSSLRWDASSQQFIYNWRTPKAPGTCLQLQVTTTDNITHTADFLLK